MQYKNVVIKKKRIDSIQRKHPWIFSGAVLSHERCKDGDIVRITSPDDKFLGIGYFQDASIMVRILTYDEVEIDESFWFQKLSDALEFRRRIDLPTTMTNAYRLIHGEGDGIPGLIIDVYHDIAVIQCHAIGIHLMNQMIAESLWQLLEPEGLKHIYLKSGNTLPKEYARQQTDGFIRGHASQTKVLENGCAFIVQVKEGQKTGFFLDQRENRKLLLRYCHGKNVLNLFSYTGGFSVYAVKGEAKEVVSVDISEKAMKVCEKNIALIKGRTKHESITADVLKYLDSIEKGRFNVIIVDPPAFAKSVRKKHNAVQAYKRLNAKVISKIAQGGIIFTFSCSQVIDRQLFYNTITAAAIEQKRKVRVMHTISQGPDHPVSLFHPEGHYLKGLVLYID